MQRQLLRISYGKMKKNDTLIAWHSLLANMGFKTNIEKSNEKAFVRNDPWRSSNLEMIVVFSYDRVLSGKER